MIKIKEAVLFFILMQTHSAISADNWHKSDIREWELNYIKENSVLPLRALYGGAVDPVNDHLEYHPVPNERRELPDQMLEYIPNRVPDFSIRINDAAQAFVRIDGEIKEVVLEGGRYAYKPAQITAAEFKKLPSLDKQSIVKQRSSLGDFIQDIRSRVPDTARTAMTTEERLWKEKSFKTCGKFKFLTVYTGTPETKHEIELPDRSILRIPTYQIQSMRCTVQGRMTVLLAYVEGGRPVEVRQSLLMLDTGIDFSAHEKASQRK
ncbi:hypothetical protein EOE67_17060 [Rheinheimera riviphila]|uniref:Uncharacterized protein n=1 Tax=Rheinheimera riviphila TaxID=1834037 RepID=A0A437QFW3_9GAMM|nr:hypothetical protein [Rheinheimera riviphila]RVU33431.1 hypothetical protein EOE67_17060 [Rheinheimera riviphila]